jgi:hypothetical protein
MRYAELRHIPRSELLDAMKESLRKLSSLELLSPDDLAILPLKRNLKAQIAELERDLKLVAWKAGAATDLLFPQRRFKLIKPDFSGCCSLPVFESGIVRSVGLIGREFQNSFPTLLPPSLVSYVTSGLVFLSPPSPVQVF